jgi:hypothetical protein
MFKLERIYFLQPENQISQRLVGDAQTLSAFLTSVEALLEEYYSESSLEAIRHLFMAFDPASRMKFWVAGEGVSNKEQREINSMSSRVAAPQVRDGAVALAIAYSIGSQEHPQTELPAVDEWTQLVAEKGSLDVESFVTQLLNANP